MHAKKVHMSREGINDLELELKLRLWFPELAQHSVDSVERGINLFSDLLVTEKKVSADVFRTFHRHVPINDRNNGHVEQTE